MSDQPHISTHFRAQEANYLTLGNTTARERRRKLKQLEKVIRSMRGDIVQALQSDFRKPAIDTELTEVYVVLKEIQYARKHLRKWMKDKAVGTPLALLGTRSWVRHESKGMALIISPWNFPFNLAMGALVSAVAAGCTVILKPSEFTPHTNAVLRKILGTVFPPEEVAVIEGDRNAAAELLSMPFHHIHFTGSTRVGKIVMEAAAKNLTSVTLELGGKSPVIVDRSALVDQAAKRVAWAKGMNAGQVCVAPDYLLVHEDVLEKFTVRLHHWLKAFQGDKPVVNSDVCGLISEAAAHRMNAMAAESGHTVVVENDGNYAVLGTTPLLLHSVDHDIMQEEIFGPLLPIIPFKTTEEAIRQIQSLPRPLASYIFAENRSFTSAILRSTRSGATCINEISLHFNNPRLPFGGINGSGIGKSHGLHGFMEFTNERAVLKQTFRWNTIHLVMPPYGKWKRRIADWIIRYL
ncbi:MAG: aldehyde dehydrogenase family protein [Flavobacteriales bacterium]|nr:aldehyde dehydrogenase family protein [Flavobacteriales bacterium]